MTDNDCNLEQVENQSDYDEHLLNESKAIAIVQSQIDSQLTIQR